MQSLMGSKGSGEGHGPPLPHGSGISKNFPPTYKQQRCAGLLEAAVTPTGAGLQLHSTHFGGQYPPHWLNQTLEAKFLLLQ